MAYTFENKWKKILGKNDPQNLEERSIFVDVGKEPETQRQLNLYYYYVFIRDLLERNNARTAIELGCGRGTIGLYLAKHMGLSVSLLDNVPEAVQLAKGFFSEHGQKGAFIVGDAFKTGIPDNSFDAVVSIGLAEHFDTEKLVTDLFKEQFRILKPGGVMISLNIPEKPSIQFLNTWMRFFKKALGAYKDDIRRDYYRNTMKPEVYRRTASNAGFRNIEITHIGPFPFFIPIKVSTDRRITSFSKIILKFRKLFQKYPYKTNRLVARSHFLVGYK